MGGGGLMQLVAFGAQDVELTSDPQVTFFKVVYRRHTNFAVESIEQTFNGTVGWNKRVTAQIARNGDLITKAFLEITLTKGTGVTYFPAEAVVSDVSFDVGGQTIDKHYNDWFRIFDELYRTDDTKAAYRRLVDFVDGESAGTTKRFYLPLLFSWARNDGNALPLIAQQYHETRITYSFGPAPTGIDATVPPQATLYLDYIYLDQDERQRFAQSQHQYLIEQLQYPGAENAVISTTNKKSQNVRLNFNHPCKAVVWIAKGTDHGVFTAGPQGTKASAYGPLYQSKLQLNGNDRFSIRYGSYFDRVQPWQTQGTNNAAGIYAYNFAFKPAEHQPSGTCNFSRIDNTTLNLIFKQAVTGATAVSDVRQEDYVPAAATSLQSLQIYAVSYNLYRVMGGLAGLAFAN